MAEGVPCSSLALRMHMPVLRQIIEEEEEEAVVVVAPSPPPNTSLHIMSPDRYLNSALWSQAA